MYKFKWNFIQDGKSWLEGIFGFHPIDCNPNVLLVFLNGVCVPDTESIPDDVIINGCMYLLKKFVGKHFDIPQPSEILRCPSSFKCVFKCFI